VSDLWGTVKEAINLTTVVGELKERCKSLAEVVERIDNNNNKDVGELKARLLGIEKDFQHLAEGMKLGIENAVLRAQATANAELLNRIAKLELVVQALANENPPAFTADRSRSLLGPQQPAALAIAKPTPESEV